MKLFSIPGHSNELLEVIDSDDSPCIITECEFSFNEIDRSILANIENNRLATERTRHFGQINRRNSLTQLDGSIFGPDETYQAQLGEMAQSPVKPTAQSPRQEIENEILRLRNTLGQTIRMWKNRDLEEGSPSISNLPKTCYFTNYCKKFGNYGYKSEATATSANLS